MKKLIFCIVILSFIYKESKASHAMGAELSYTCTAPNTYEIKYTFYRDCRGIDAPTSVTMDVTNVCGFPSTTTTLTPVAGAPQLLSFGCPADSTTCSVGSYLGVEKWVYTGFVVLSGDCPDWNIGHSENARNAAITTIAGAGADDLYVYALINNSNSICNNSPVFTNDVIPSVCVNEHYCLQQVTLDVDGDSLSFQMIAPLTGELPGDTITYLAGYSATQPLHSNPPMSLDVNSGEVCFTPTQQDVTPLAILVREYRNGILIGEVERDFQLNVEACSNNYPLLTGLNGTHSFISEICADDLNCFTIRSMDADVSDSTRLVVLNSIQGMTFQSHGAMRDSATLCWTPILADTAGNPHCVYVSVFDNNCPNQGSSTKEYCFNVVPPSTCNPTTTNNINTSEEIKIFYSPENASIKINTENIHTRARLNYSIINSLGKVIMHSSIFTQLQQINTENLKQGLYYVYISDQDNQILTVEKIIVLY